jgi:hypothetical protein
LVLPRVRRQVYVLVCANTGDDLINQPDQVEGFAQDVKRCVIISILLELMICAFRVLADEHPIGQLHVFPLPTATMAGLTGGEEAPHLDHLSTALLSLRLEQVQELAKRGV